jgi:nicotinic acid mononucleotide adenylyltransferase
LVQLATSDSDWIDVLCWGWANPVNINEGLSKILNERFAPLEPKIFLVVGSDHGFCHGLHLEAGENVVCIHRNQYGDHLKEALASEEFLNPDFILVDGEPVDISSTQVRTLLKTKDWPALEEILHPAVVEHFKSLSA